MKTEKTKPTPEQLEEIRLSNLMRAAVIAEQLGWRSQYAIGEIADLLEDADEEAEQEFAKDIKRAYDIAVAVFKVPEGLRPDAEQVFFCLERVILGTDE